MTKIRTIIISIASFFVFIASIFAFFLWWHIGGGYIKYAEKTAMPLIVKIEKVSYNYIVKQLGEPWMKGNNYVEFYIKPECLCGLSYCALSVTFDEEKNIESIAIIHPD